MKKAKAEEEAAKIRGEEKKDESEESAVTQEFNSLAELIGTQKDQNFTLNLFPDRYEAGGPKAGAE